MMLIGMCAYHSKMSCATNIHQSVFAEMYDAYDTVVEIVDSEWLMTMKKMNETDFNFWQPNHFCCLLRWHGTIPICCKGGLRKQLFPNTFQHQQRRWKICFIASKVSVKRRH